MIQAGKHTRIDICICTYNRAAYLKLCLEKLLPQIENEAVVVSIIDNNSNDETADHAKALEKENNNIRYVLASEQGLSFARNMGWKTSSSDWVFYLDDDCLPSENIVQSALDLIAMDDTIDAFGGPIDAIFEESVPEWMPDDYGSFAMPFQSTEIIEKGFIRGGCFLVRRTTLEALNGFNTTLGVTGNTLQYGEEIELQIRMRQQGKKIAYAPSLRTGHFVRKEKLNLWWVLRSEYARRRDKMIIEPKPFWSASILLLRTTIGRCFWTPVHFVRALFQHNYTFGKAVYQSFKPLAYSIGEWVGVLLNKSHSQK